MEREDERSRETMKEAKRLKEFLEDYDDDRDDPKYYRGSALQKRLRDREKEIEMDERDRKREKEELEEIRQRLLAEGHPDPDAEMQRMEEEAERRRKPPLKLESEEKVKQEKKERESHRESHKESHKESHRDSHRESHRESQREAQREAHRESHKESHRESHRDREKRTSSAKPAEPTPRDPPPHSEEDEENAIEERWRRREEEEKEQQQQQNQQQQQQQQEEEVEKEKEQQQQQQPPPPPQQQPQQQHVAHNGGDSPEARLHLKALMRPINTAPSVSSASGNATPNTPGTDSPRGIIIPGERTPEVQPLEEHRPKIGLSLKLGSTNSPSQLHAAKRKKLAAADSIFNKFNDDEEADEQPRKRKLVPLDYGDDDKSLGLDGADMSGAKGGVNTEEKRKNIRSLIEKIPTARPELFTYPLDWSMVDSTLMDRRIKPWINKKIIEYIGEEEATLVDFVCSKVMAHSTPQGILDDVAMVLDEEAEVFIVKMWRLLIFETEFKKIGLAK
uniref:RNA binding motif protein 25 n=3 Tax=Hippocampus comes TaxID=109280 RepID=A0A3Q2YAK3_HIPCM